MSQKNKVLPYLIFGVPIAIGLFFVYKALAKPKGIVGGKDKEETPPKDGNTPTTPTTPTTPKNDYLPFKKGSRSEYVKYIQTKLGISSDGVFGTQTHNSVVAFQKSKGLVADGIVGAKTWKALFGADFPKMGNTSTSVKGKLSSGDFTVGQGGISLW